jgi:hydroxypyruvate isomerase
MTSLSLPGSLRFAANIGMLFQEQPFLERFHAAAEAGFEAVEFPRLYGASVSAADSALRTSGVHLVQFSMPRGDIARGDRGVANDPRRIKEFHQSVEWTLDTVARFGCTRVSCPIGNILSDIPLSTQWSTVAENLHHACERAASAGVTLLIEPLNVFDHPGTLLTTMAQARSVVTAVAHTRLRIMYDVYHMQRTEGNLTHAILEHFAVIDHVQIADSPGRHQPGTGEINYAFVLQTLVDAQFSGWCGLEYQPRGSTRESLEWMWRYAGAPPQSSVNAHVSRL